MQEQPGPSADQQQAPQQLAIEALLLGDRIDTAAFQPGEIISTSPLAMRAGQGMAVVFRYGVVVFAGMSSAERAAFLGALHPRIQSRTADSDEEGAMLELCRDTQEEVRPGGPICLSAFDRDRLLLVADTLAKSVLLARIERGVGTVFDTIEPYARDLAERGGVLGHRRDMLRIIGRALVVHQQVTGRAAVAEKPDALWDKPELERLYGRLSQEYELDERVEALERKLTVISETANALKDLIDTQRSLRLEVAVVMLIVAELLTMVYQLWAVSSSAL